MPSGRPSFASYAEKTGWCDPPEPGLVVEERACWSATRGRGGLGKWLRLLARGVLSPEAARKIFLVPHPPQHTHLTGENLPSPFYTLFPPTKPLLSRGGPFHGSVKSASLSPNSFHPSLPS